MLRARFIPQLYLLAAVMTRANQKKLQSVARRRPLSYLEALYIVVHLPALNHPKAIGCVR